MTNTYHYSGRFILRVCGSTGLIALVILAASPGARSQTDYRPFRSVNHIVMAARPLAENEQWSGPFYTEEKKKVGITNWGASCGVSEDGQPIDEFSRRKRRANDSCWGLERFEQNGSREDRLFQRKRRSSPLENRSAR